MIYVDKNDAIRYGMAYKRAKDLVVCNESASFVSFIEGYALALKDADTNLNKMLIGVDE